MTPGRFFRLDLHDERVIDLLAATGVSYSYGAGEPKDFNAWPEGVHGMHGGIGYDCSGAAQLMLVRLGKLSPDAADRGAMALSEMGAPVTTTEEAQLGDLVFYASPKGMINHVMVSLGGHAVIGASGGDVATNGDDPRAFVMIRPIDYRPVVAIRRF